VRSSNMTVGLVNLITPALQSIGQCLGQIFGFSFWFGFRCRQKKRWPNYGAAGIAANNFFGI